MTRTTGRWLLPVKCSRRRMLELVLAGSAAVALTVASGVSHAASPATAPSDAAQKIADHFATIRSMTGEFVQFGPKGEQTGGKFFIERPGKVRFNYEGASGFKITSDGDSVALENPKMKTMDLYPLSKTPLKLLLEDRIDLSGNRVKSVKEEEDQTVIELADKSVFGNARISLMFDPKSYELRQWTIRDAQGKDTTVMIFNVKEGVKLDDSLFAIDYDKNLDLNKKKSTR